MEQASKMVMSYVHMTADLPAAMLHDILSKGHTADSSSVKQASLLMSASAAPLCLRLCTCQLPHHDTLAMRNNVDDGHHTSSLKLGMGGISLR